MQKSTQSITLSLTALISAIVIGWVIVPSFVGYKIRSMFVLSPDINPSLYSAWIHPPMPIYFKIHLFNVTNPEDVANGGKPRLVEMGPYVFRENRTKIVIQTDEDSDTITYKEYLSYEFDQENSKGVRMDDEITVINVPFLAAGMKIQEFPWPLDTMGSAFLTKNPEPLFVRKKVEDVLFNGWKVPLLDKMESKFGVVILPNNTFSFFLGENDTTKGPYTVSRGINDPSSFGSILKYQGEPQLKTWQSDSHCNAIRGTDGSLFRPFVNKQTTLRIFNPNMCQSVYATFRNETEVKGVKTLQFSAPKEMIADPRESEENACYCVYIENEPEKCLKQGAFDLGPCREDDPPVAISPPHFLDAHPDFLAAIESGLAPDRQKHGAFINVEPTTGVALEGSSKLQVNLIIKPVKRLPLLAKLPDMLFPLLWADECGTVDDGTLDQLVNGLNLLWLVDITFKWVLLSVVLSVSFGLLGKTIQERLTVKANLKRDCSENKTSRVDVDGKKKASVLPNQTPKTLKDARPLLIKS